MPQRLLVFVLFVLGLLVSTIASAATTAYAGTRVGAFDLAAHVGVGLSINQAAEKHRAIGFTCDGIASGSPHAAEAAPGAGSGLEALASRVNPQGFCNNCGSVAIAVDPDDRRCSGFGYGHRTDADE